MRGIHATFVEATVMDGHTIGDQTEMELPRNPVREKRRTSQMHPRGRDHSIAALVLSSEPLPTIAFGSSIHLLPEPNV